MCDSGKTGWLQKCAVLKYSGCVLRSSRVLFGSLLQEDIFLHFFFFFLADERVELQGKPNVSIHKLPRLNSQDVTYVSARCQSDMWHEMVPNMCAFVLLPSSVISEK